MVAPRIAVIEDDLAIAMVISDLLTTEGFQTFHWCKGTGAYELIKQENPSAVILDIRMEHDRAGKVILDILREDSETRDIPVIICTADDLFVREYGKALRAQQYEIIPKPFQPDDLLQIVQTAIRSRDAGNTAIPAVPPKIAFVLGVAHGMAPAIDMIADRGYGVAGWRWGSGIQELIQRERPALVVMDIEAADRSAAWFTLNRLKRNPRTRDIPVVIHSANALIHQQYGGRYPFLSKPTVPKEMLEYVGAIVGPSLRGEPAKRPRGRPRKKR